MRWSFSTPWDYHKRNGGEEKRGRQAKENDAVNRFDRPEQLPAVLQIDARVPIARHRTDPTSDLKSWKVFIVDNASVDDSVSKLSDLGPNCILLESKDNLGFAGGCNLAAQVAKEQGIPYLFFLNNDAKVESETLSNLVETCRTLNNDAILGAIVRYFPSGELQFLGSSRSSLYGTPDWYPGLESELCRRGDLIETDFVFGAAMFVPTKEDARSLW
jgi:GT2 family glycosyltransferase